MDYPVSRITTRPEGSRDTQANALCDIEGNLLRYSQDLHPLANHVRSTADELDGRTGRHKDQRSDRIGSPYLSFGQVFLLQSFSRFDFSMTAQ